MTIQDVKDDIRRNGINRWVFQIPLEDIKITEKDTTIANCCFLCGEKINGKAKYVVQYLNTGVIISSEEPFIQTQGFYPIGSECRKNLPNNFVFSNR